MKNIKFNPIEEKTLNDKLVNLYGAKIPGLYSAVKPLFDKPNAVKPALPLLIELKDDESYENADLRVMVFGRETNNWDDQEHRKQFPFYTYNFNLTTSDDVVTEIMGRHVDGEDDYFGLGDIYHDYCYEETGVRKTIFTRHQNQLIQQLKDRLGGLKVEVLWNNVLKIGRGGKAFGECCGKPWAEIREIEREYFNVVAEEVGILKPDVIIFLTGYEADQEIREIFNLTPGDFNLVKEGVFLHRINIPGIKYAARTIHPSSRRSKEDLTKHFDALVDDIVNAIR